MRMFVSEINDKEVVDSAAEIAVADLTQDPSLTLNDIREATIADPDLRLLTSVIQDGFPETHHSTDAAIRQFYNVRNEL
jgi:hypothetical protein